MESRVAARADMKLRRCGVLVACVAVAALVVFLAVKGFGGGAAAVDDASARVGAATGVSAVSSGVKPGAGSTTVTSAASVGVAGSFYGPINTQFEGLAMFRGNASRTYYG